MRNLLITDVVRVENPAVFILIKNSGVSRVHAVYEVARGGCEANRHEAYQGRVLENELLYYEKKVAAVQEPGHREHVRLGEETKRM